MDALSSVARDVSEDDKSTLTRVLQLLPSRSPAQNPSIADQVPQMSARVPLANGFPGDGPLLSFGLALSPAHSVLVIDLLNSQHGESPEAAAAAAAAAAVVEAVTPVPESLATPQRWQDTAIRW
eukprot:8802369-Heterocapsa_arctica.AAC.1